MQEDNFWYTKLVARVGFVVAFLTFHFVIRKSDFIVRISSVVALWVVVLQIPLYFELEKGTGGTLMSAVICFCVCVKITESMLLIPREARLQQTFWQFSCKFLFFMFMLKKGPQSKEKRSNISRLLFNCLLLCATAAVKLIICVLVQDLLFTCIIDGSEAQARQKLMNDDYVLLMYYNTIWLPTIVAGMWAYDLLEAFIPLFTLDNYRYGPFNNWVGLSSSITELWGKRYNLLISGMLKSSVFVPMKRLLSVSNAVAGFSCFAMSGILHIYVIRVTMGPGYEVRTLIFFGIHGIACTADAFVHANRPKGSHIFPFPLSIIITLAFMAATLPLYTRPLIFPSMLGNSAWSKMVPLSLEPYLPRLGEFLNVENLCFDH